MKKRMMMPVDMDARSKVVHVEDQHQIWIMDIGYGTGQSSKVFQIYDYVIDRWPKHPFNYNFPHVEENEQLFMGNEAINMIPG